MTDAERAKFRVSGLLAPSRVSIGRWELRPLSLASLLLADRLGMDLMLTRAVPETLARFLWSHSAPIDAVRWAVFADHWEDLMLEDDFRRDGTEEADLVAYLIRSMKAAEAAWIQLARRKPPGAEGGSSRGELPPVDLLLPDLRAVIACGAARMMPGLSEDALLWETPLARVLAWYHVSQSHREDVWTVAPRSPGAQEQARGGAALSAVLAAAREEAPEPEDEDLMPDWVRALTVGRERGDDGGLDV